MPHDHATDHRPDGAAHGGAVPMVEVTRGDIVESCHWGAAVIADAHGRVADAWGDFERPVYPRSAVKAIQALAIVETGAAAALDITEAELALACASHTGEPAHTRAVGAWLARMGLSEADLECGAHPPYDEDTAATLIRRGEAPGPVHNNCSGKHTGMLATALHRGEPTRGYAELTHPVQQRILGILEMMTGQDLGQAPRARDGCSIPTFAVSLGGLAVAMSRLADPDGLPDRRAEAVAQVRRAWGGHPHMVGGRGRFDTALMTAVAGRVLTKGGAEGVHCACLPGLGLGIALKVEDGTARAGPVAMGALLRHVGALGEDEAKALAGHLRPPLVNRRGFAVGEVRPAAGFPS